MTPRLFTIVTTLAVLAMPTISFAQNSPSDTNAAPAPIAPVAPAAAPATTTTDSAATSTERPTTYTVQKGDAVATIAHKFGITWAELRKANGLKKNAILQPGQVLKIPAPKDDKTSK